MKITHLQNKEIDYSRWDTCVSKSCNQLAYAFTWYLDIVSPNWEALVSDNYEYIMPLPIKKKYGISYLVQPILTQQLGIFSEHTVEQSIVKKFIKQIPSFSYELHLNENNYSPQNASLPNLVLNINEKYEVISSKFSKNTIRNISKAQKLQLKIQSKIPIDEFMNFYYSVEKKYRSAQQSFVKDLITKGISENAMTLYGVYSANETLIASLCILHSAHRITYLLPISNDEGKASSAMFLLIDTIIRNESGKSVEFDFEGSSIDGIARFYKGFGALNKPYNIIKQFRPNFLIGKLNKFK
ncbi:MAG: hypothetical protein ACOYM7_06270 [Paludibacter sp.]